MRPPAPRQAGIEKLIKDIRCAAAKPRVDLIAWYRERELDIRRMLHPQRRASKKSYPDLSVWPPTEESRQGCVQCIIEMLSAPPFLLKYYDYMSGELKQYDPMPEGEASETAKRVEEEAFTIAASHRGGDGIGVYNNEICKRLYKAKLSRSITLPGSGAAEISISTPQRPIVHLAKFTKELRQNPELEKIFSSMWLPTEECRDTSFKFLIRALSVSSFQSNHYDPMMLGGEVFEMAKHMEEEAFTVAAAHSGGDAIRVYFTEIYKSLSKTRFITSPASSAETPQAAEIW